MHVKFNGVIYIKSKSQQNVQDQIEVLERRHKYVMAVSTQVANHVEGRVLTGKDARNLIRLFGIEIIPSATKAENDSRIGQQLSQRFGDGLYDHLLRAISAYALLHEATGHKIKTMRLDKEA